MGVVYKLKKNIVDFIIERKTADPRLTCREIAELVLKTFNVRVSKSSVHKILQDNHIRTRGSVPAGGSPQGVKKSSSFKIPPKKKKEIHSALPPVGAGRRRRRSEYREDIPPPQPQPAHGKIPNETPPSAPAHVHAGEPREPSQPLWSPQPVYVKEIGSEQISAGAGIVFFKVLEWMLSDEAICEPYLRDLCVAADLVDIRTAARLAMDRALFGQEKLSAILTRSPRGILALNNIVHPVSPQSLDFVYRGVRSVQEWRLWLSIDLPQLLQWVGRVDLINGRHETVTLDAGLHFVSPTGNGPPGLLNHVLGRSADDWIQNTQPGLVAVDPGTEEDGWRHVKRLIQMAHAPDVSQRMCKLRVSSVSGAELGLFECDPFVRTLIIVMRPENKIIWSHLMRRLRQPGSWSKGALLDRSWRWQEAQLVEGKDFLFEVKNPHGVCLIHDEETDFPVAALISNNPRINAATLLDRSLPSLLGILSLSEVLSETGPSKGDLPREWERYDEDGAEGDLDGLFSALQRFWLDMAASWYGLTSKTVQEWQGLICSQGCIRTFEQAVRVDLTAMPDGWSRDELLHMIDRIHLHRIHDFENRVIILSLP